MSERIHPMVTSSHHSGVAGTHAGPQPIPVRAGIGLRAVHQEELLEGRSDVAWLEAHSENYFADGGPQIDALMRLRARYPLSLHGVGLSLGSTDPLDPEHLRLLKRLVDRTEPALISEHCAWSSVGGRFLNDLLPMPYTEAALRHMVQRVDEVQNFLGRQILIENVSSYLQFSSRDFTEAEFLAAIVTNSGCGLLLDINNVYVSSRNHGFDPYSYIEALAPHRIHELHLAGHSINRYGDREICVDTHSSRVNEAVWRLFDFAIEHIGAVPTLIEWDNEMPTLDVLLAEAIQADLRVELKHGRAA